METIQETRVVLLVRLTSFQNLLHRTLTLNFTLKKRELAMNMPDFYIASGDSISPQRPIRKCYRIKRVMCASRDDCLLIRIDPPFDPAVIRPKKFVLCLVNNV